VVTIAEEERDNVVLGYDIEGRADSALPGRFNVEERGAVVEEQGTDVEAHAEDTEEGAWGRHMLRSGRQWVCDGEMTGLGFRGLGHT
jgi:hypothetical protein